MARLYYDVEEGRVFDKILDEKLDEELFDRLCDNLFEQINNAKNAKTEEEIFEIVVKCWPSFTIFDVISKCPEYASESMIRRLNRIRKETESFSYKIEERINTADTPKDFIFFKGKLVEKQFENFIQENKITIKN